MIKRCRTCGKIVDVLWPDQWAYYARDENGNRRGAFFCSWKCLRKEEEKKEMAKRGRPAKKPAEDKAESVGTPAQKDGGAWGKAEDTTVDVQMVYDPQVAEEYQKEQKDKERLERMKQDIKEGKRISFQEPLEVAAVYSRVIKDRTYRKTQDQIILCGMDGNLFLTPGQWRELAAEIHQMLKQLGV